MWHEVHCAFQCQHGDIEAIRLWRELEVGMHIDATHAKGVGGQRFNGRIDDIIAQRNVHLTGCGTRHTMTGSDHMTS